MGPAVSSEELVVPAVAPSAPDAPVVARFAPDALTVGWNASADDGGALVTGYRVVDLGEERADEWVGFSVHSTPRFAGWVPTDAAGGASTALPSGLDAGTHHVVVYDAAGGEIGYASFEIDEAPTGQPGEPGGEPGAIVTNPAGRLSATGVEPLGVTLAAGILLVLGLALAAGILLALGLALAGTRRGRV